MAKALVGHVGLGMDPRVELELRRLQRRVRELEAELAEARAARALDRTLSLQEPEPVLA